jgi:hypothetical protein
MLLMTEAIPDAPSECPILLFVAPMQRGSSADRYGVNISLIALISFSRVAHWCTSPVSLEETRS